MNPKHFFTSCLITASTLLCGQALAQDTLTPPDQLVKTVSSEVIEIVKKDRSIQAGNTQKILALVDQKVLPHFDFKHMTSLAMATNWSKATPDQQTRLVAAFRTLLVRTYSNALSQYRDQIIDYKPVKLNPADKRIRIKTEIKQPGTTPVVIDYWLEKTPTGWKVYDVVVGGVSLVQNYRNDFAAQVRANGIDGLINSLEAKNKSLAK